MGKRVLVTGASGFVGANLARRAVAGGHDVHLILRHDAASSWRVRELAPLVRVHRASIEDAEAVRAIVAAVRPDWVFHLAAYGGSADQIGMARMVATNLLGCAAILDACVETGVEAFVNAGSSSEYGDTHAVATESDAIEPNSHYAVTKAAATHYCQFTARSRDVNASTVRFYTVYGPFEDPARLIPTLLVHAIAGRLPPLVAPETARDFVYVDDAVDALLRVASTPAVPRGAVYNVCTGAQTSLRELVALVRELSGVRVEPAWGTMPQRAWDTAIWTGSPAKIADEIGWRAQTSLAAGLARTIDWFRRHPERLAFYSEQIVRPVKATPVRHSPVRFPSARSDS